MVHHAKDLAMPDGSKEAPNSYVKVFLNEEPAIHTYRENALSNPNANL